jgi:hypothetical protein
MRQLLIAARPLSVLALSALAGCPAVEPPPEQSGFTCDGDLCTVTGPILQDTTFTADKKWVLKGGVFVGDDTDPAAAPTTLTIEPGTTIFGDTATVSFLLITRGSTINAEGTREQPIVFTSAGDVGSRARGQWGGLVINGQAPVNGCSGDPCTLTGEAGTGTYGGNDAADSSGVIKFVRLEFPGKLIDDENELNGIALQGVGSGTTLDFIQVHMGADDCIEFFGGTANAKHIVCTGAGDDNLDWTFGWAGKVQFLVAQQHADAGERGVEADNNEDNFALTPISNPTISNLSLIGLSSEAKEGIKLRRGTKASIHNAVIVGFDKCVDIDDGDTFEHAAAGDIVVSNSVFDCEKVFSVKADDPATTDNEADPASALTSYEAILEGAASGNSVDSDVLESALNVTTPDFRAKAGAAAAAGAVKPADAFFDDVAFRGAVGTDDWTAGWTAFPAN